MGVEHAIEPGGLVAIARALAMDPEILFFDEPSAGLDPIIAAGIDELILKLKKAFRITIVVVTHELASAFLIADRMIVLDKGVIVANATTGRERIKAFKPIDRADGIDDWLYLPETLYAFLLILIISAGAGPYSVDAAIWNLIIHRTG